MGLDITHNCWSGSYTSFHYWREKIAELLDHKPYHDPAYPDRVYRGDWTGVEPPEMVIDYLLVHSDCDGQINPEQGRAILPELQQALEIARENPNHWDNETDKLDFIEVTEQFIHGLEQALEDNQPLLFW